MIGINLKREAIKKCQCGADASDVDFWGSYSGSTCSHLHSNKEDHNAGWWLRIDHSEVLDPTGGYGFIRGPDRIGKLLCPPCLKEHNEEMDKLMKDIF